MLENKIQDEVGDEAWGMYAASVALCFLFGIAADLGIGAYATQQFANNPERLKQQFPYLWGIKLTLAGLFPLLILGVGYVKNLIEPKHSIPLGFLLLVSLLTSFTQIGEFLRSYIRGMQDYKKDSYLSVLEKVLYVAGIGFLLIWGAGIHTFVYMRVGIWVVTCGAILFYLTKIIGFQMPEWRIRDWGKTLGSSVSFSILLILASINEKIDQVLLQSLCGDKVTGTYAGAYRWLDAVFMFLWVVLPFFFARFAYLIKDYPAQQRLFRFGQLITAVPLLFVSLFVFFHGEKLFFLFGKRTPEDIIAMTRIVKILFAGGAIYSVFSIFDNLMTSTGFTRQVNIVLIFCIFQNIILNLIFIPRYGAEAAAWATVSSYCTMAIGYIYIMSRYMQVKIPWIQMGKLFIVFAMTGVFYYFLTMTGFRWFIQTLIAGGIYVVLLFVVRLVPEELQEQVKSLTGNKNKD